MGLFDNYLSDLQKEVTRVTDGVAKLQNNTQSISGKVVKAIDELEDKVTNLPTEADIKKKLKQTITSKPHKSSKRPIPPHLKK